MKTRKLGLTALCLCTLYGCASKQTDQLVQDTERSAYRNNIEQEPFTKNDLPQRKTDNSQDLETKTETVIHPQTYSLTYGNGEYRFDFTYGGPYIVTEKMLKFIKKHATNYQESALDQIQKDELNDKLKERVSGPLQFWLSLADTNDDNRVDYKDKKAIVKAKKILKKRAQELSEAVHENY